jgi:hypothetical protein
LKSSQLKSLLGLPVHQMQIIHLIPDLLVLPLGYRRELKSDQAYPFMVCQCLFDGEIKTHIHQITCWPPTAIADQYDTGVYRFLDSHDLNHEKQYIKMILYRYIARLGDWADRNFILYNNQVYSLYENTFNTQINLANQLNVKKYAKFCNLLQTHHTEFTQLINQWREIINSEQFAQIAGINYTEMQLKINQLNLEQFKI